MNTTRGISRYLLILVVATSVALQVRLECRSSEAHHSHAHYCSFEHSTVSCHVRSTDVAHDTNRCDASACGAGLGCALPESQPKSSAANLHLTGDTATRLRIVVASQRSVLDAALERGHGPPNGRPLFITLHTLLI